MPADPTEQTLVVNSQYCLPCAYLLQVSLEDEEGRGIWVVKREKRTKCYTITIFIPALHQELSVHDLTWLSHNLGRSALWLQSSRVINRQQRCDATCSEVPERGAVEPKLILNPDPQVPDLFPLPSCHTAMCGGCGPWRSGWATRHEMGAMVRHTQGTVWGRSRNEAAAGAGQLLRLWSGTFYLGQGRRTRHCPGTRVKDNDFEI